MENHSVGGPRGRGAMLKDATVSRQVLSGNPYAPCGIFDEVSNKVIAAVPGQCHVQESWKNLSRAPVAYQMQQLIGDQFSDYAIGIKRNLPPRKVVNDHQKTKGIQSHNNGLKSENRNVLMGRSSSSSLNSSTRSLTNKSNHCPQAMKVDSSLSISSLDSTRSLDSENTFRKKRNKFTKISSVGSAGNIPSLTDGWVPLDWSPSFDSAKLYNSSEFPELH
ncbi:uncharacterized protein LOC122261491 isoform X2 [Penaeus japonicus]|uniref:uncharacterized protein LOC122261491 isoform X2 n=1 Tax=Penaeus japonicus TaxID=27405 RepID=UPI001C71030A|nr:uncharacterized protein LOC122261491 isoform X2 [Penaeus japonicus]